MMSLDVRRFRHRDQWSGGEVVIIFKRFPGRQHPTRRDSTEFGVNSTSMAVNILDN
jgi:hypothetical protein